jgi:tripartite-type tricarboxylate transporter receptor subunit TctC
MNWKSATMKLAGGVLFVMFVCAPMIQAQTFPTKPITLIIPVGAGGSHDLTARALSSVAMEYLGQPLVIQLKPGGGGAIGTDFVAKAAPDGHTLLFGGPGWNTTLPAIDGRSKGPEGFEAICRINYSSLVVGIRPGLPYKTFKQMLEWAKANPGQLVFGYFGPWGQGDLFWKQISKMTGITYKAVPYDGAGPALMALLGGHVDTVVGVTSPYLPYVKSGKMLVVAILDDKRDPSLPDVPTAKEQGIDTVSQLWRGILAPKGTPRPILDKLALAFKKMTEDKSFASMIDRLGDGIQYLGPDEFTKVWTAEYEATRELGRIFKK